MPAAIITANTISAIGSWFLLFFFLVVLGILLRTGALAVSDIPAPPHYGRLRSERPGVTVNDYIMELLCWNIEVPCVALDNFITI